MGLQYRRNGWICQQWVRFAKGERWSRHRDTGNKILSSKRATVVVRVISRVEEKKTESLTGLFGKKPNYQSIFAMEFGHRECDFVYKMYHGVTSLPFLIVIVT